MGDTITQARADQLFLSDLTKVAETPLNALSCVSSLGQNQFDALASITFNAGSGVLSTGDMITMFGDYNIMAKNYGPFTTAQLDTCSREVSNAFHMGVLRPKPRIFEN